MKTQFRTNVDVAKPFMEKLNEWIPGEHVHVGDKITILKTPTKIVEMLVVDRTWEPPTHIGIMNNYQILVIELNLTYTWTKRGLKEFENHVRG